MSCRELVQLVTDYLEGALSDKDRRRFEAHLELCDGCATYLEQIRETVAVSGELREESLEPDARDALLDTFRAWRSERG